MLEAPANADAFFSNASLREGGILFYGDPHGKWRPLYEAAERYNPCAVVILGDVDCESMSLAQCLAPIMKQGRKVRWVHGNHDSDSVAQFDLTHGSYGQHNLSSRWEELGGVIVAGLGGVFKESVWYPRFRDHPDPGAKADNPTQMIRSTPSKGRFRSGLPIHLRDAIFPSHVRVFDGIRADILVCHEAPTTHRNGFAEIDRLAVNLGARLIVHGHHHESLRGLTLEGIPVRGLAKAEPWCLVSHQT